VERALAAAQASLQVAAFDAALGLVATAETGAVDELQHARIDLLRAQLAFASSRGTEATPLLLAAARRLEPLDAALARETYVDAFSAALFGARLSHGAGPPEVAEAARAAPRRSSDPPRAADLLLDALVAVTDDYATAVPLCRDALRKLSGDKIAAEERLRWLWQGCVVALEVWDDESAYSLSQRNVEIARETGTHRAGARAQRTYPGARVLRRARRRRRDGRGNRLGTGGDGDQLRAIWRVDRRGVAGQAARDERADRDDDSRRRLPRRGNRHRDQRVRARGPLQRLG
jgi:hypothetical protein